MLGEISNHKHQIPNKHEMNGKKKTQNSRDFVFFLSSFLLSNLFGIWCLELGFWNLPYAAAYQRTSESHHRHRNHPWLRDERDVLHAGDQRERRADVAGRR